jgi:formamidopyrimidine-DNA glycosylase
MPEIAEVMLMSDYINSKSAGVRYGSIEKSDSSKVVFENMYRSFIIKKALARSKELMIECLFDDGKTKKLFMSLGMSGNFTTTDTGTWQKHCHLRFCGSKAGKSEILCFVDVRKFAKWQWRDGWSKNRGPDPIYEKELFRSNFISRVKKSRSKLCDVMLDQKTCAGIGNYLRAEICYELNFDPFRPAKELLKNPVELEKFFSTVNNICNKAYKIGGAEFMTYKNPNNEGETNKGNWMKCYNNKNMLKKRDNTGRTFWFDPKWK